MSDDVCTPPSEQDRVEAWRTLELIRCGYPDDYAAHLARNPDVDIHRACELLRLGCNIELAVDILR